jgi:hypothetical protein
MHTMKKTSLFFVAIILAQLALGQITEAEKKLRSASSDTTLGWKNGGMITLNFSQASFSNWAAGGQNSISFNGLVSVFANLKKEKYTWDNMLDIGYGFLQQGKNGSLIKTDDKIDFSSVYGRNASKSWYYAALLNFKTQMAPGYNYPNDSTKISGFLAPAYLVGAVGMDYKPNSHYSAFIGPLAEKTTFVNNTTLADSGAYGVDKATYNTTGVLVTHGKKTKNEFGGYLRMVYQNKIFKDSSVSFLTKLDLFSNYLHNPSNLVVNWEINILFKVNKFISATFSAQMLYDDAVKISVDNGDGTTRLIGPRLQFKELIGIGFSYKL